MASREFSEEEADQLFAQSRQVDRITYFLSHTWQDSRHEKWLALCLHFNLLGAMLASSLLVVGLKITGVLASLPAMRVALCGRQEADYGPWCCIFGASSFFFCLHAWHYMPKWLLGSRGVSTFLDKVCVHQADPERKQAGICAFAHFIAKSERVLCLWSPGYFTRLWCMLEMAAMFASSKQAALPLVVLPLKLYKLEYGLLLFLALACAAASAKNLLGQVIPAAGAAGLLCVLAFMSLAHAARRYVRDRVELDARLRAFSVDNVACASEEDRAMVTGALQSWFGEPDAFNELVRTRVRAHVAAAIGSEVHVPLALSLPCMLILAFQRADLAASGCYEHPSGAPHIAALLQDLAWMFCLGSILPMQLRLASCAPGAPKRWAEEWATTALLALVGAAALAGEFAVLFLLMGGSGPAWPLAPITAACALRFLWLHKESLGWRATAGGLGRPSTPRPPTHGKA